MKKKYQIKDKEWFEGQGFNLCSFDDEFNSYIGTIQEGIIEDDHTLLVGNSTFCVGEYEEIIEPNTLSTHNGSCFEVIKPTEYTDKHYDVWYTLTEEDVKRGEIKIDPYFVSKCIKLGSKDESCSLWHIFKTLFRWGEKNSIEREVKAVEGSLSRYKEVNGIE